MSLSLYSLNKHGKRNRLIVTLALVLGAIVVSVKPALADVHVAVASNFAKTARDLASRFEATSDARIVIVVGSSGKHYAQIINGAPFDVLLSADQQKPARLHAADLLLLPPRTYAIGRLALWSPGDSIVGESIQTVLEKNNNKRLAMANPKLAPYGVATSQALSTWDSQSQLSFQQVIAENVSQAYQFADSGNVELAFVAVSQLQQQGVSENYWTEVPNSSHSPILQDAAVLKRAADNPDARAFFEFLFSPAARSVISESGYELVTNDS